MKKLALVVVLLVAAMFLVACSAEQLDFAAEQKSAAQGNAKAQECLDMMAKRGNESAKKALERLQ